jgi:hypothetical protein
MACQTPTYIISSATQSSSPSGPSLTNRILELNCLVQGDDLRNIFPVKIDSTESVGSLKKAIWIEKKHAFQHVDTNTLVL